MANCHVDAHSFDLADVMDCFSDFGKHLVKLVLGAPTDLCNRLIVHLWKLLVSTHVFSGWNQFQISKWIVLLIKQIWVFNVVLRAVTLHGVYSKELWINNPSFLTLLSNELGIARPYSLAHFEWCVRRWFVAVNCMNTFGVSHLWSCIVHLINFRDWISLLDIFEDVLHCLGDASKYLLLTILNRLKTCCNG